MSELDRLREAVWQHAYTSGVGGDAGWVCNFCRVHTHERPPMPVDVHEDDCVLASEIVRRGFLDDAETVTRLWHYIRGLTIGLGDCEVAEVDAGLHELAKLWLMQPPPKFAELGDVNDVRS